MKEYLLKTISDYKIMAQAGVKQYVFPLESEHNAIWDSKVLSDGKLYFSLSTELSTAGYARLYYYDHKTHEAVECFKAEEVIMPSDKAIRASKFHTSISELNDGRLVMTTHTTDKSPRHPSWMPYPYYHHVWEGYAGSNIIIYDRETGKAENLGIPVPHESIYGAVYDAKHNALFFTGFFRGHTYRYSFDDHKLIDFGQMSENFAFRLLFDKNGNILGASRSGYVYKIDTETLEIQDLNYRVPFTTYPEYTGGDFKGFSNGGIGPDGRLYICPFYGRHMVAYDSDTNTFEDMGDWMPGYEKHAKGETRSGVFAMEFDNDGVLWYAVFSRNCGSGVREIGMPSSLFRWDIAGGGEPEWLGIIGTKERFGCWTSEICIGKDDMMYIIGSNHATDGPDITVVDLKEYVKNRHNFGTEICTDPYCQRPTTERYDKIADFIYEQDKFGEKNNWKVELELAGIPTRLWRALAPDHIDSSAVKALFWEDKTTLTGICGGEKEYLFRTVDGEITELIEKEQDLDRYRKLMEKKNQLPEIAGLPYYPGRQYQAVVSAAVTVGDKQIVGTKDGMLAVCENGKVFSLGPAVYNGPIRDLCVTPDGKKVFGVGGHEDDMGILFSYDEENGLRWLGHITYDSPSPHSSIHCPIITSCAVSSDGKRLAVGSGDRLGQIIYYSL